MARKCSDCSANMRVVGGSKANHYEDYIEFCPHCCGHDVGEECDCSNCRPVVQYKHSHQDMPVFWVKD
jgi:hypothetical protein